MPRSTQDYVVSSILEDQATLQARFQELGYLFIKGYVAQQQCKLMLAAIVKELAPYVGFDAAARKPILEGQPFFETDNTWDEVYPRIQSLESFHSFFHDSHIQSLMETVSGKEVFVYPIKMARISTPGKIGYETPPHQDAHSHHAGPTMAGIWVALHDVNQAMGRVKVLAGSHKGGVRPVFQAEGVGGVQCEIYPDEDNWHVSDFEQGDVLIFHSCCVHKAEPNTTDQDVRISIDTRFCDFGAPVFSTNLEPHHGWRIDGLDWDSIYKNWQQVDYQYYWKDYPNLF
jgi:ectoine hydroxylase-related dioxygenase (phytanoyl-CoA dioxygenase family)